MTKRSAPSTPTIEQSAPKKQKIITEPLPVATNVVIPRVSDTSTITQPEPIKQTHVDIVNAVDAPEADTPVSSPSDIIKGKKKNKESRQGKEPKTEEIKVSNALKAPTIQDGFNSWIPDDASLVTPNNNGWWGLKPISGDPRPCQQQPSARESNGATNPPMYENRGFRFKRGSRFVKYFGPVKPEGADDGPDLDQEDLLVLKLIDMRPQTTGRTKAAKNGPSVPKRTTVTYFCEHGKPKDWNDIKTIKTLNDRRTQAIDRITKDAPWTAMEREYLSELIKNDPDASIWDLTERHNDYFMGKECVVSTGWELSEGRSLESLRHEYVTYKPVYDRGSVPKTRWSRDRSEQGERLSKMLKDKFGPPAKVAKLANADEAVYDDKGSGAEKLLVSKKKKITKKSPAIVQDGEKEAEITIQAAVDMSKQPKLSDDDEELLQLAGLDKPELIHTELPSGLHSSDDWSNRKTMVTPDDLGSVNDTLAFISDSPMSEYSTGLESPGAKDYKKLLATLKQDSIASIVATRQLDVIESVEVTETDDDHIIATGEQTATPSATMFIPGPRAMREIDIDEDYDE